MSMGNSKLQGDAIADKCAKYTCFFLNPNEHTEMKPHICHLLPKPRPAH